MKRLNLILCLVLLTTIAFSQIPKAEKNTYVNDFAHVLSPDQTTDLNKKIFLIEKNSSVQFAVVLIDKLPEGYEIEDYALLLARKWHVGTDKDGLVYVAAIKQHKQRLETATNLNGTFTEAKCQEILGAIKPSFKAKDYYSGLQTLVSDVSETLNIPAENADAQAQQQAPANQQAAPKAEDNGVYTLVGILAFALIIYIIYRIVRPRRYSTPVIVNNGGYGTGAGPGYNTGPYYGPGQSSGLGSFAAGAALGAIGGYAAARAIEDDLANQQNDQTDPYNNNQSYPAPDTSSDNNSSNWGNWGGGSDSSSSNSDSGFSSDDSSNGSSSDW